MAKIYLTKNMYAERHFIPEEMVHNAEKPKRTSYFYMPKGKFLIGIEGNVFWSFPRVERELAAIKIIFGDETTLESLPFNGYVDIDQQKIAALEKLHPIEQRPFMIKK